MEKVNNAQENGQNGRNGLPPIFLDSINFKGNIFKNHAEWKNGKRNGKMFLKKIICDSVLLVFGNNKGETKKTIRIKRNSIGVKGHFTKFLEEFSLAK